MIVWLDSLTLALLITKWVAQIFNRLSPLTNLRLTWLIDWKLHWKSLSRDQAMISLSDRNETTSPHEKRFARKGRTFDQIDWLQTGDCCGSNCRCSVCVLYLAHTIVQTATEFHGLARATVYDCFYVSGLAFCTVDTHAFTCIIILRWIYCCRIFLFVCAVCYLWPVVSIDCFCQVPFMGSPLWLESTI